MSERDAAIIAATRAEAIEELRQFVGMKVEEVDGRFVEVARKPRWWWPR